MGSLGPKLSSCGQGRLSSDWADAQTDPSLCWAYRSFHWYCHTATHVILLVLSWSISNAKNYFFLSHQRNILYPNCSLFLNNHNGHNGIWANSVDPDHTPAPAVWARSCENVSYAICEQQRCRSACASAQSDQHLCCSLLRQYDMYTCCIQSFVILASFCSWAGWFVPYLVENPRRYIFAWCGSVWSRHSVCIYWMQCNHTVLIWVSSRENLSSGVCDQVWLKPACSTTETS